MIELIPFPVLTATSSLPAVLLIYALYTCPDSPAVIKGLTIIRAPVIEGLRHLELLVVEGLTTFMAPGI